MFARKKKLTLLYASLIVLTGCGGPPSVTGTITYDGEPIKDGSISFAPFNGQGAPFGSMIKDGAYKVEKAYLGKRRVTIAGYDAPQYNGREIVSGPEFTKETVPENAVGNYQEVEIVAGAQTLDFHLEPPQ